MAFSGNFLPPIFLRRLKINHMMKLQRCAFLPELSIAKQIYIVVSEHIRYTIGMVSVLYTGKRIWDAP
jgi:hypothetical protein